MHEGAQSTDADFRVVRQIAHGAMSDVYEIMHDRFGRAALKIALRDVHDDECVEYLQNEAASLRRLPACGQIVGLLGEGACDEGYVLLLEYIDGISLQGVLDLGKPIPMDVTVRILSQVLWALEVVHEAGIVHRDMKPSNVMLARSCIKLIDFGLAVPPRPKEEAEKDEMVVGTPAYVAPEACVQPNSWDMRSDLYAVGLMFYRMLIGRHPLWKKIDGEGVMTPKIPTQTFVWRQVYAPPHLDKDHLCAHGVPREIAKIISRAIEKSPEDRFQSAKKMRSALLAALP